MSTRGENYHNLSSHQVLTNPIVSMNKVKIFLFRYIHIFCHHKLLNFLSSFYASSFKIAYSLGNISVSCANYGTMSSCHSQNPNCISVGSPWNTAGLKITITTTRPISNSSVSPWSLDSREASCSTKTSTSSETFQIHTSH